MRSPFELMLPLIRPVAELACLRTLFAILLSCGWEVVAMRYLMISALAFMLSLPVAAQDFQKGLEAA